MVDSHVYVESNMWVGLFEIMKCRLIKDVERTPLVIPFVHTGMQDVMPIGSKFPYPGKKVESQVHEIFMS